MSQKLKFGIAGQCDDLGFLKEIDTLRGRVLVKMVPSNFAAPGLTVSFEIHDGFADHVKVVHGKLNQYDRLTFIERFGSLIGCLGLIVFIGIIVIIVLRLSP